MTVLAVLAAAGARAPDRASAYSDDAPGLASRLQRIEASFRQGDAGSLRSSFSTAGKVRVELDGLTGGQGCYGPGQLQMIFSQAFDEAPTREFAFSHDDVKVSRPATTAFAKARWVRAGGAERRETADTLTFTLREEGGDWRILEIRSSR